MTKLLTPDSVFFQEFWHGKRYYSLDAWLKNRYGRKIMKIALDGGFTCPNRDGTLDNRGCTFCSPEGSGDFACSPDAILSEEPYVAYFQAFTSTYGPVERLRNLYETALSAPLSVGISIATRPDCLGPSVLALLLELVRKYPEKLIWIELGLQTIHAKTADRIRRGYPLSCFDETVFSLKEIGVPVIVHTILGLPGETQDMIYETMDYLNKTGIFGIKLQLLHVLSGTDMGREYEAGLFNALTEDEYLKLLIGCICRLSPDIVIHRVTGDGPKAILLAPLWSLNKKKVLNELHHRLKKEDLYQGKNWKG